MNKSALILALASVSYLTACGGGGGGGSSGKSSTPALSSVAASSLVPSSIPASSVAPSSVAPSSTAPSSTAPSSLAPSSVAASSAPASSFSSLVSSSSASSVDACAAINRPQGFATQGSGTTGGADVGLGNNTVIVSSGVELNAALSTTHPTFKDKPLVIYINGLITWENSNNAEIRVRRSNVSIIGLPNAEFSGVGIRLSHGASNIVIRNLLMHEVPQSRGAGDHIHLDGQDGAVSNVWIDHNEFYNDLTVDKDFYDELVSGRSRVHNVTISYNYLHDSQKTSLWGSSDDAAAEDVGRTISFHHNHWKDVVSRLPLFRFGEGHVWNNYYNGVSGSGINSRMGAKMRVDNNVFENVKNAIWSGDSSAIGFWDAQGNSFTSVTWSGSFNANCATPPCYAGGNNSNIEYLPPYSYSPQDTATVKAYVLENAGRNKITACLNLPEVISSSSSQASSASSSSAQSSSAGNLVASEDFAAADAATFFTSAYKAMPNDASKALYRITGGGSNIVLADGQLSMNNARFTIGDLSEGTATAAGEQPNGAFNLAQPYRVKFTIEAMAGTGNVQVYVDNNTTSAGHSIHSTVGSTASRLTQFAANSVTSFPHEVIIESSVGTANSFFQIRADSNVTRLTIENLTVEYQ